MTEQAVRDPAKTAEYYARYAAEKGAEFESVRRMAADPANTARRAGLVALLPQKAKDLALAAYSSGAPVGECLRWLGEAVDARLQLAELHDYRFPEYGHAHQDFGTFSGALLLGREAEVVGMQRRCTFADADPVPRSLVDLMEQYCEVLAGEPVTRQVDEKSLKKVAPDWLTLPPLFQAVAARDEAQFAEKLEAYLSVSWEAYAKGLRRAAKNPALVYFGTWDLLSAALCRIMGRVPELSKKTRGFVPAELVSG